MTRHVAIDVETAQPYDHVIEIGAVEIVDGRVGSRTFVRRVRPVSAMSPHCQAVHGISLEELKGEPPFAAVLPELLDFVGDATLVAHNIAYERNTFQKEFLKAKARPWDAARYACTMAMAKKAGLPAKLREACAAKGIPTSHLAKRHDALSDALMCAELFLRIGHVAAVAPSHPRTVGRPRRLSQVAGCGHAPDDGA